VFAHELAYPAQSDGRDDKETVMDLFAGMPEWLVWCAAGIAGAVALAAVASVLDAALDLDAG
jgi:hypothetical protein